MSTQSPVDTLVLTNGHAAASPSPDVDEAHRGKATFRRPGRQELNPARYRKRRRRLERTLAWLSPILLVVLWQVASDRSWLDPRFFPSPTRIWDAGVETWRSGLLWDSMYASFKRVAWGFVLGCLAGIVLGIPLGLSRLARAATEPLVYALWTVPKLALLPLLLLIFGLNEKPLIVLIIINCFFLVLIPTQAAIKAVPHSYREAALSFRANRFDMLRHVIMPAALPQIFVALRLAAGAAILVMVGAEFVQANVGLGHMIWNSWSLFLPERMYVGIVVVAVAGAVFTLFIGWVGKRLSPWDVD
jgi:NitT/TauT family transport system permease protein/sulfonate transport system permease protein